MIFGQARSQRTTALIIVGAVVFVSVFVGLVYNNMDSFQLPTEYVRS
jgi:hypothetical protein